MNSKKMQQQKKDLNPIFVLNLGTKRSEFDDKNCLASLFLLERAVNVNKNYYGCIDEMASKVSVHSLTLI